MKIHMLAMAIVLSVTVAQAGTIQLSDTWSIQGPGHSISGLSTNGYTDTLLADASANRSVHQAAALGDFTSVAFAVGKRAVLSFTITADAAHPFTNSVNGEALRFSIYDDTSKAGISGAFDYGTPSGTTAFVGAYKSFASGYDRIGSSNVGKETTSVVPSNAIDSQGASANIILVVDKVQSDTFSYQLTYDDMTVSGVYVDAAMDMSNIDVVGIRLNSKEANKFEISNLLLSIEDIPSSAPVADDISIGTPDGVPVDFTLSAVDPNGDAVTYMIESFPANGELTGTVPNMTYTPTNGVGVDGFTYTAFDTTGLTSTPATVSIQIVGHPTMGIITNVGLISPMGTVSNILLGGESSDTATQAVKHDGSGNEALLGQTFVLPTGFSFSLSEIYLKSGGLKNWDAVVGNLELKVYSGIGKTLLATYAYDVAAAGDGTSANDNIVNDWLKLSLGDGLELADGGTYSFQAFFTSSDNVNNWAFRRDNDALDIYPDGGGYYAGAAQYNAQDWYSGDPWNGMVARPATQDQMFYIAGVRVEVDPYDAWSESYSLSGSNALLTADVEPDGVINLLEYALGGNPTIDDAAAILPTTGVDGAWFNYVYRRQNPADPALSYAVLSSSDLVNGPITNATSEAGTSAVVGGFETVTNRVSTAVEGKQFLKLNVERSD